MNLHKNARTCPKSRAAMVHRVLEERVPVSVVAEQCGVSRNTVYKWIRRYCAAGEPGLRDGSSEPRQIPHRLGQDWVDLIVEMRRSYRMTALRIANQLRLSRSSVAAVLQREGLSQLKKLEPPEPVIRYEHDAPGGGHYKRCVKVIRRRPSISSRLRCRQRIADHHRPLVRVRILLSVARSSQRHVVASRSLPLHSQHA